AGADAVGADRVGAARQTDGPARSGQSGSPPGERPFLAAVLEGPQWRHIVEALRAARSWGIPPLTLWGGDGTWTNKDRLLVQALHLYERGLCPCGCGHPARISHNPKFDGLWSKDRVT